MKLSIIVPVYNDAPYIEQALRSVFEAAPAGTEVIVVDDGSSDGSLEIAERMGAAWHGPFRLLKHPDGENRGPGASRNLGVQAAVGEWIAFLDGDDYYLPDRFNDDLRMISADASWDGVAGATRMDFQETASSPYREGSARIALPKGVSGDQVLRCLVQEKFWHVNALTVRRSSVLQVGGFAEHLRMSEDCLLGFKLAAAGRLSASPNSAPVAVYRRRSGSTLCVGPESRACLLQAMAEAWRWGRQRSLPAGSCEILRQGVKSYFIKIAGSAHLQKRHREAYLYLRCLVTVSGVRFLAQPGTAWLAGRIVLARAWADPQAASIVRRAARKLFNAVYDRPLRPPEDHEKTALSELVGAFSALPEMDCEHGLPTEVAWRSNMNKLRDRVLRGNPREFLRWSVIYNSMFIASAEYLRGELAYLKSRPDWGSRWRAAIREIPVGRPSVCSFYPSSSGNLIHHAYHCAVFEEQTGMSVHEMDAVVEFGGGYGSLCRLFHNLGFRGRYIVFDLAPFSLLQRYYLKTAGFPVRDADADVRDTDGIVCLSDRERLQQAVQALPSGARKMFVATWSISEVPVALREEILSVVSDFQAYLIAYQERFGEVDNIEYFEAWSRRMPGIRAEHRNIVHLPSDWYLMGARPCAALGTLAADDEEGLRVRGAGRPHRLVAGRKT